MKLAGRMTHRFASIKQLKTSFWLPKRKEAGRFYVIRGSAYLSVTPARPRMAC